MSKTTKYRQHAATMKLAQWRAVPTVPYWTGAGQCAASCPNSRVEKRSDYEDGVEEHIADEKRCFVKGAQHNWSVCGRGVTYAKDQMRKSPMPEKNMKKVNIQ